MDAEVWPDERVTGLVEDNFLPARLHVKDDAADFKRFGENFGAHWTPTILFLDPQGIEHYRIEGFLPVDDFLAQLNLGLGHLAFQAGRFDEAGEYFQTVVNEYSTTEGAPEGQYWAGVSRYKSSGDAAALAETALAFDARYQDSSWAKKASVWKPAA
ncbi:MAG TPA: thioredoxin fold domain-containing protein [Candidatus Eisenbacteria bacterium]